MYRFRLIMVKSLSGLVLRLAYVSMLISHSNNGLRKIIYIWGLVLDFVQVKIAMFVLHLFYSDK